MELPGGEPAEGMARLNLGGLIGELRMRLAEAEGGVARARAPMVKGPSKEETILAALRGKELTQRELHELIGGSKGSLGVYLANLKGAGKVLVSGERMRYRYTAA